MCRTSVRKIMGIPAIPCLTVDSNVTRLMTVWSGG